MTTRSLLAATAGIFATLLIGAWIKDGMRLPTWENIVGAEAVAERPPACIRYDINGKRIGECDPVAAPPASCLRYDINGARLPDGC